eukprot:4994953-Pleurochrysis_carterae.AAC.1
MQRCENRRQRWVSGVSETKATALNKRDAGRIGCDPGTAIRKLLEYWLALHQAAGEGSRKHVERAHEGGHPRG